MSETVPPIPATCAARPTVGGLVAPYINTRLADGGVDFRTPHQGAYEKVFNNYLCQTCGGPLGDLAVFFGGPNQLAARRFDEPPLCPPCAVYASRACPMVAGRQPHYATRATLSESPRGKVCATPGCECGGLLDADPTAPKAPPGDPAHRWYAVYMRARMVRQQLDRGWHLTAHHVTTACTDGEPGCLHQRLLINGAQLTAEPAKIILVSEPGRGRLWQRTSTVPG